MSLAAPCCGPCCLCDARRVPSQTVLEARRCEDEEHGRVSFENPQREFDTLTFLNYHRSTTIVRTRDAPFSAGGHLVAVLEWMPGGDLLELVTRHRRFDEATARHFFGQITQGLRYAAHDQHPCTCVPSRGCPQAPRTPALIAVLMSRLHGPACMRRYMHDLRVAHLDLSLENVVLSRDYRMAKLIDFGLAVKVDLDAGGVEQLVPRGARGKLFYVAPEVRHVAVVCW